MAPRSRAMERTVTASGTVHFAGGRFVIVLFGAMMMIGFLNDDPPHVSEAVTVSQPE